MMMLITMVKIKMGLGFAIIVIGDISQWMNVAKHYSEKETDGVPLATRYIITTNDALTRFSKF
jgi:hypothetical protein